ncbi:MULTISPECIES: hypothetical protein [unclassified Microbacterium]|uniref:hypothetical protein n=1 Tax=unclassified Microbacterium TaxID=2609290 RepID=UPI00214BF09A|nr:MULTISPECIES: hypothetical protein [unclassified Microbacterium]MCR2810803.1 hypothetical protein [Microbacterium sp. zg.B185]WIM19789.1 hypothetical protein QNO12_03000 [Microbacterium sp. zg-B185]
MRKRRTPSAISEEEQIARYAYVLGNVPASVADRAYAAAFTRLSAGQRQEIVDDLRSQLPVAPQEPASEDPVEFAVLMRDLHARSALVRIPGAATLAAEFVASPPIAAYFTVGAGSVTMDQQPPWIHDLAGHDTAPIDGGRMHHRRGADSGEWYA